MAELCGRYQISRETGYQRLERYRREGEAGLHDRSRALRRVIEFGVFPER
jgi:transposase